MKNNFILSITFTLLSFASCIGQITNPQFNDAFLQDEVAVVKIDISQENLNSILDSDNWGEFEVPATFIYETSMGIDTVEEIGFRLRGNTSLGSAKKSFKVSFTEYSNGRRWKGLKKLNLNGEHNDVSIMRSRLCWDLIRDAGLTASRTSYVRLYINEEFKGVYLNVEHIDDEFVGKRYSEGNGNLYKCTWPADLNYEGSSSSNYETDAYELKTNEWNPSTYEDIAEFITVLNQSSNEELRCALPQVFNVREYIKNLAMEVLIGHWDGYSVNKNNFYLYSNLAEQRIEFLEYDLDNTLGIDWFGIDWSTRNIYNWSSDWEDRPLFEAIMENPNWRDIYTFEINRLIEDHFNYDNISEKLNTWKTQIQPYVQEDTYYSQDYGFQFSDFLESDTDSWGNHVSQGILEYVDDRVESALNQLETINPATGIFYSDEFYPVWDSNTLVVYFTTNPDAEPEATLSFSIDGGNAQTANFINNNDGWFSVEINFNELNTELSYQIQFQDGSYSLSYPCSPKTIPLNNSNSPLVINELMADNESSTSDENGSFEDWLEVYNTSSSAISLGSYFVTDNLEYPNKWKLPNVNIQGNDHRLFWCDDDPEEGAFHTNFSLFDQGETLYLFEPYEDGFRLVDYIDFPTLANDESYGREDDGAELWIVFSESTPEAENSAVGINSIDQPLLKAFPNPTENYIYLSKSSKYKVIDSTGKIVNSGNGNQIDLSNLETSVYYIHTENTTLRVIKL